MQLRNVLHRRRLVLVISIGSKQGNDFNSCSSRCAHIGGNREHCDGAAKRHAAGGTALRALQTDQRWRHSAIKYFADMDLRLDFLSLTGDSYSATVIGSDPATDSTTTIPVYLIPVKIHVGGSGGTTFSPETLQSNGKSAVNNTRNSPLLKDLTFDEAGTDLGDTQYIDAYQRANFWSSASTNKRWHMLLGAPTVLPIQEIKLPLNYGIVGVEFGVTVALADMSFIDVQFQAILADFPEITPNSLVIFEMYDTYLTSEDPKFGGCCIGGYHGVLSSGQVYMAFSYGGTTGVFSEDVDSLSHELAESAMDPFVDNNSPCGLLEVADPLVSEANYGAYPYVRDGFTYHLQDLTFITYFGAPAITSLASRITFQGTALEVCAYGG